MPRSHAVLALAAAGLGGLFLSNGACHEPSHSSPAAQSLGISAFAMWGEGQHVVLFHQESTDGEDLNLDGDRLDAGVSLYDRSNGSHVPLALAVSGFEPPILGANLIALPVDESLHGASDLNDDGDALDEVLFVFDHRTGLVENTGLAWPPNALFGLTPVIGTDWVLCPVLEGSQGEQDLDANGFVGDVVLFAYDSVTGARVNLECQTQSRLAARGDEFAFQQSESREDLNGDGDTLDSQVLRFFDAVQGFVQDQGFELVQPVLPVNGGWLGLVDEAGQGADLNGDGDTLDGVYHLFQPQLGTAEPLGFSFTGPGGTVPLHAGERYLVLPTQESDGRDHNGDGDQLDILWGVYDLLQHEAHETGIARGHLDVLPAFCGDSVAIPAWEVAAGADLNGDGRALDFVLHLFHDGSVENTGLDTSSGAPSGDGWIALGRSELLADRDGNADGDLGDRILHLLDPTTGELVNTHLATQGLLDISSRRVLMAVEEDNLGGLGRDLNGDGDAFDDVWATYEIDSATTRNLHLAADSLTLLGLTSEGDGVFLVSEESQARDLNGDGDRTDAILYRLL
jgi:hypothetical protein